MWLEIIIDITSYFDPTFILCLLCASTLVPCVSSTATSIFSLIAMSKVPMKYFNSGVTAGGCREESGEAEAGLIPGGGRVAQDREGYNGEEGAGACTGQLEVGSGRRNKYGAVVRGCSEVRGKMRGGGSVLGRITYKMGGTAV